MGEDARVAAWLKQAASLYRQGGLAEAVSLCRRCCEQAPANAEAWHLLGLCLARQGETEQGVAYLRRSLAMAPGSARFHANLGGVFDRAGREGEAEAAYRQALALDAGHAPTHNNLGVALKRQGRLDEAESHFRRALALAPEFADPRLNLGHLLLHQGRAAEAEVSFREAIALGAGGRPGAVLGVARALLALRRPREAEEVCRSLLQANPGDMEALSVLSSALLDQHRAEEAEGIRRRLWNLRPDDPDALNDLGVALNDLGRTGEAESLFRRALALRPGFARFHNNLGNALRDQGAYEAARDQYLAALSLQPGDPGAAYNLGLLLLTLGEWAAGWPLFEGRWHPALQSRTNGVVIRDWGCPQWEGQDLAGKALLVVGEQGYGDEIQFCRYARLLAARGARVRLLCAGALAPLFREMESVEILSGEAVPGDNDYWSLAVSLPRWLGTLPATVPFPDGYLRAPGAAVEKWARRLAGHPRRLRIGLCWSGNPGFIGNRRRQLPFPLLARLAEAAPGALFVGLQKGPAADEARLVPEAMPFLAAGPDLEDFADTAGLMANLDLVVTVDTSVAHLAGALGRPAWVLLSHGADWRWLLDREGSPWYSSLRLFRQRVPGDWEAVVSRVGGELAGLVRDRLSC